MTTVNVLTSMRRERAGKMAELVETTFDLGKKKKQNKICDFEPEDELAAEGIEPLSMPTPPVNPMDEIPIEKLGPSTFEELLERELAREQGGIESPRQTSPVSITRSNYLKRGE